MAAVTYFPPEKIRPLDRGLAYSRRYAGFLSAMGEGPLDASSEEPTWRLLVLPTFAHPLVVRLEAVRGRRWRVVAKRNDGRGGWFSGPNTSVSERRLSGAERRELSKALDGLDFRSLPVSSSHHGCDGTRWLLEWADAGEYHVAHRWSPKPGAFLRACERLLRVAGLSEE